MIDQVVGAVALIVIGLGLIYCVGTVLFGLHGFRREQTPVGVPSRHSYGEDQGGETEPEGYHVYFLIAALNEQEVIGRTVASLLTRSASAHVIVVDDGSDDQTGPIARSCGERVITLRRDLPEARQGKGAALNFGFATVVSHVRQRGLDPARIVVCVMDADGRLSADALRHVVPESSSRHRKVTRMYLSATRANPTARRGRKATGPTGSAGLSNERTIL